ncbi:DEAD/DEAH box helicase [Paramylibacter kogurei]|uniref:DEAD/DEAH box helicase n=1 Tax=Paramylibacter kogurei TaxID=1889778 RepID=UPI000C154CDB|nr:DEAD/DEAH box helicase [Amylibacter kogurei]
MTKFTDLGLSPKVLKAIADVGYDTPTPIQAEAIPPALEGRDVLGIAQTGTGKTAGFTLPMIHKLARGRARARMPRSLVLAPTRELAAQVAENFELYAKYVKLDMALLIGGVSFNEQDKLIDRGVDVLIATPGRLLDHFERGKLLLTGIEIMVVDEADRMLDMGFIPDIERIFKLTPFTRQTLFFSATMAPEITRITQEFLQNPTRVEVARQATTSENIEQKVCCFKAPNRKVEAKMKRDTLRAIIESQSETLTNGIIFCNRKVDVDIVLKSLKKHGYNAGAIHGDLDQRYRMEVLNGFRNNDIQLLVASDVAARGLDIPNVSHVFNYDVPIHSEDYVHRIGRTGRAGRSGWAFMLCLPHEQKHLDKIEELVKHPIPRLDAPVVETPKSTRAPKTDKPKQEQKPAPQKSAPAKQDKAPAKQDKAPAKSADNNEQNNRSKKSRNHKQEPKNTVKGMGDHMPAFMTQSFDFVKKDPAPQASSNDDADATDDA